MDDPNILEEKEEKTVDTPYGKVTCRTSVPEALEPYPRLPTPRAHLGMMSLFQAHYCKLGLLVKWDSSDPQSAGDETSHGYVTYKDAAVAIG